MPVYEILAKLAQGATAELFAARATDRIIVIKRLRATDVDAAKAFLAESLVAATLEHPNVVRVFEVGTLHGAFIVTREYVDGETLASLASHARVKKLQIPIRAILTIAAGAAEGLQYAHERSMHGDMSPANVIVSHEGTVKLLEVTSGDRSDDLVGLGRALWELLTLGDGQMSPDAAALPAPSLRRFDIPSELDAIVVRLLRGEYESADDVLGAIDLLAAKLGFQLSTTELARMMRLWYGSPPEVPQRPLVTATVSAEPIERDIALAVAAAAAAAADDPLADVRDDDDARSAVAALATTRPREDRATAVPGVAEVEETRENFEQIRDRILAQARKKKETRPPMVGVLPGESSQPIPLAIDVEATPPPGSTRRRPDTLDPNLNAYAYITRVAETASAPAQNLKRGDTGAANAALHAAASQVEQTASDEPVTTSSRTATLRMGEVVARPVPVDEPRVGESSPVKLGPELVDVADTSPVATASLRRPARPTEDVAEDSIVGESALGSARPRRPPRSTEDVAEDLIVGEAGLAGDETVVLDEIALPRPGRLSPAPPLASVAATRMKPPAAPGSEPPKPWANPDTKATAEMKAIDAKAIEAAIAAQADYMKPLLDTRTPDMKKRDDARTTAQMRAIDALAFERGNHGRAEAVLAETEVAEPSLATAAAAALAASHQAAEARAAEAKAAEAKAAEAKAAEAKAAEAKAAEAKAAEAKAAKAAEAKAAEAKSAKAADHKAGKAGDHKSNSKSTKAADTKASKAKDKTKTEAPHPKANGTSVAAAIVATTTPVDTKAAKNKAADPKADKRANESSPRNGSSADARSGSSARSESKRATPVDREEGTKSGTGWLVPGLLVIAAAAGILVYAKRGDAPKTKTADRVAVVSATDVSTNPQIGSADVQQFGATPIDAHQANAAEGMAPVGSANTAVSAADQAAADKAAKAAAEKSAAETAANEQAAKVAADQAAKDKAAEDKAAKVAAEKAAKEEAAAKVASDAAAKVAAEKAAKDKVASDKAAKLAADNAVKQQAAADKAAKLAADKAAKEQAAAKVASDAAAKVAAEKAAKDKAAADKAARLAAENAAKQQAAADKAAKLAADKAAKLVADQAAKDKAAATKTAADKPKVVATKANAKASEKTTGESASIEQLFSAGDYAKANEACIGNSVFTAERLNLCALAACHTNYTVLAKRWVNAIAKSSRDDVIAKCKALGVDLAPPAASAPPAAPPPQAPTPPAEAPAQLP